MRATLGALRAALASRDEAALEHALHMCGVLPSCGAHLPSSPTRAAQARLQEEGRVAGLLARAVAARDRSALLAAVAAAVSLKPPFAGRPGEAEPPPCASLAAKLEEDELAALRAATGARDRDALAVARRGSRLALEADAHDEVRHALALRERLDDEADALEQLREAVAARDGGRAQAFLPSAASSASPTSPPSPSPRARASPSSASRCARATRCATRARRATPDRVRSALEKARRAGVPTPTTRSPPRSRSSPSSSRRPRARARPTPRARRSRPRAARPTSTAPTSPRRSTSSRRPRACTRRARARARARSRARDAARAQPCRSDARRGRRRRRAATALRAALAEAERLGARAATRSSARACASSASRRRAARARARGRARRRRRPRRAQRHCSRARSSSGSRATTSTRRPRSATARRARPVRGEVRAALAALAVKVESPAGIESDDCIALEMAVGAAKKKGLPDDSAALAAAAAALANAEDQIKVQALLASALSAVPKDKAAMRELGAVKALIDALLEPLDEAERLELNLISQAQAESALRSLKAQREVLVAALPLGGGAGEGGGEGDGDDAPELDPDALAAKRAERNARARNPKFKFANFPALRGADDYAKGVVMQKKQLKEGMLQWQAVEIPRSLTELAADDSKLAVHVHKSLLGYMGEKQMSFPAMLAQDVLQKGLAREGLRDELYCQLMKQLSANPKADSIAKGWQVMCMCVSTFPPSDDLRDYLVNFLLAQAEKRGAVRNYAKYCARALDGILESGASGFVPATDEIEAYAKRPPILATIRLVDGMVLSRTCRSRPTSTRARSSRSARTCSSSTTSAPRPLRPVRRRPRPRRRARARPRREPQLHAGLPRTPKPLRNDDYLGDQVVLWSRKKRGFQFVFKRKIFLPSQTGPSDDAMYARLVYLQAEADVVTAGRLGFKDEALAAELAAISLAVADGALGFPRDAAALAAHDPPALDFVPKPWRGAKPADAWAAALLPFGAKLGLAAVADDDAAQQLSESLQRRFVEAAQRHEAYGAHFFVTRKKDYDAMPDVVRRCRASS